MWLNAYFLINKFSLQILKIYEFNLFFNLEKHNNIFKTKDEIYIFFKV